jgi:YD repeat-containing protein
LALEQLFFEFDGFGQKASMTDPDMGAGSYGYDLAGNLARQTDARNQRSCYYYDALNRLKDKTYSTGTAACPADPGSYTVSYSYDAGTNGKGQRTGMANPSGSTAWEYDVRGRMTRETKVINGAGGGTCVTQWTAYDAMDRVRSMVYPDSKGVTFDYTAQGPIKAVFGSLTYYVGETLYNALGQATDRYLGSTAGGDSPEVQLPSQRELPTDRAAERRQPHLRHLANLKLQRLSVLDPADTHRQAS